MSFKDAFPAISRREALLFSLERGNCLRPQVCISITALDAFHIGVLSAIDHLVVEQDIQLTFRPFAPLLHRSALLEVFSLGRRLMGG